MSTEKFTINVFVKSSKQVKKYRCFFRKHAIYWNFDKACFEGEVSSRRFEKISGFCRRNYLVYKIVNDFSERSTTYRADFFKNNKPVIFNRYLCVYCGRLMTISQTTVDHLYPVGAANKSIRLQKQLKRKGLANINDVKNLVPACERCNKRKGRRMGKWLIAGKIGQITWLWAIRYVFRIAVVIYLSTLFF